uniref:Uncharacterized protein n=1 Tax=Arundo donax TaxID=35708 RepID=A0A0A8XU58_ARUDO
MFDEMLQWRSVQANGRGKTPSISVSLRPSYQIKNKICSIPLTKQKQNPFHP